MSGNMHVNMQFMFTTIHPYTYLLTYSMQVTTEYVTPIFCCKIWILFFHMYLGYKLLLSFRKKS